MVVKTFFVALTGPLDSEINR